MSLEEGETFDRYTIEALVGEGGMGTVYRAWDPRLQRRVALKVLRTDRASDHDNATDAAARMVREARSAAALEHANCVAIFDVGEHEGARFIAMEFVEGSALRRYIGDKNVSLEHKVRWLVDVARALSAAHKRGLIHRDVKPENVMVREDDAIKVLDFGIAKRATDGAAGPSKPGALALDLERPLAETAAGTVSGTPHYMAPEQIRQETLDPRTDQFAWGVMAYELLSGRHPFRDESHVGSVLLAIVEMEPLPLARLVPQLPAVVQAAVQKALSKAPADRFSSMDHVVSVLEPFGGMASGRTVSPGISAPGLESVKTELATQVDPRLRRPERKRSRVMLLSVVILALAGILLGALSLRPRPTTKSTLSSLAVRTTPAAAHDASAPLAMTAAEPPSSRNPDALAAYAEGLQAFRAATFETARRAYARAVSLDPSIGAAWLRGAILSSLVVDETEARKDFRRAVEFRTLLSERDRLLLDAFEPYLQREPSDVKASEQRLAAATALHPEDAELRLYLGTVQFDAGDVKEASATFEAAIALDPEFAEAWSYVGATQSFLGDLDRALASFDQCLAISLGATDCLWYRVLIHDHQGECARVEADARTWIAKSPDDPYAYHALARALFAQGRGDASVRAVLEQSWTRTDEASRAKIRVSDELKLDLIHGDFAQALERTTALETMLTAEPSAAPHGRVASYVVRIDEELGRSADASRAAARYLERKDAWGAPTRVDDVAISTDLTPEMLAARAADGSLPASVLATRRTEWMTAWEAKTSPTYHPLLWIYGYAASTRTLADAKIALDALPKYEPLPPYVAAAMQPDLDTGRVFLLGGRTGDAVTSLTRASRSCLMFDEPVDHVRANLLLGRALEKQGDRPGACAAYGVVLSRWGTAKPRSVSADDARSARARLACGKEGP